MVKNGISRDTSNAKTAPKEFETELETQISQISLDSLQAFIELQQKYQKIHKTCKNIKKAYTVLSICLVLQGQIPSYPKLKSNTIMAFKQLFDLQKAKKSLQSSSFLFQFVQNILNLSTTYTVSHAKTEQLKPISCICLQLIKIFMSLKTALVENVILRLLENDSRASVYSYLTRPLTPFLPMQKKSKFTLVLDMDETLGHYSEQKFYPRPGVFEFLATMSKKFELVLYTSACEAYANLAMSIIDPQNLVSWRLYRQHLIVGQGKIVKDLRVLGRDLNKVIIVDNDPRYFENQPMNGIQIKSWYNDQEDTELKKLKVFLEDFEISDNTTAQEIVEKLANIKLLNF